MRKRIVTRWVVKNSYLRLYPFESVLAGLEGLQHLLHSASFSSFSQNVDNKQVANNKEILQCSVFLNGDTYPRWVEARLDKTHKTRCQEKLCSFAFLRCYQMLSSVSS